MSQAVMEKDKFNRKWILETAIPIVKEYGGNITIRALHYRLVAKGMTNTQQHYKRVTAAMGVARWENMLAFEDFVDHDRDTLGSTEYHQTAVDDKVEEAMTQVEAWMTNYSKNRWENQPVYLEVFIEKKALQGVFEKPCALARVALNPCKGYPSLTYLNDAAHRLQEASSKGKECIILYYGDHDPSGDDIPRSIAENWNNMGLADFSLKRMMLTRSQVLEMDLPPAPTKTTDSRSASWNGLGQVELDAVEPKKLSSIVTKDIADHFDEGLYAQLKITEATEQVEFTSVMEDFMRRRDK